MPICYLHKKTKLSDFKALNTFIGKPSTYNHLTQDKLYTYNETRSNQNTITTTQRVIWDMAIVSFSGTITASDIIN